MKIVVQVKTKSKLQKVEAIDDKNYKVWVKALPVEGKANEAVVAILADYFKTSKSKVRMISGFKAKKKVLEIN